MLWPEARGWVGGRERAQSGLVGTWEVPGAPSCFVSE